LAPIQSVHVVTHCHRAEARSATSLPARSCA